MYEAFYGFTEKPFSLFPDHRFLFLNRRYKLALSLLEFGVLNRNGMILLTGDPGTGKTTLLQKILETIDETVIVGKLPFTHDKENSLLPWVVKTFGLQAESNLPADMFESIAEFCSTTYRVQKGILLVVDEAQNLNVEQLEELKLLFNLNDREGPVFQILLAGHTQLREELKDSRLTAFVQRVGTDFSLEPFNQQDTRGYICHRIHSAGGSVALFSDEACDMVYRWTQGNPRLINQLCETSLIYGFSEQAPSITESCVSEAARDRQGSGIFGNVDVNAEEVSASPPITEPGSTDSVSISSPRDIETVSTPPSMGVSTSGQRFWEQGRHMQQEGWHLEAIQAFKQSAAYSDFHRAGWFQVGRCYQALARPDEALEAYRAALTNSSDSPLEQVPIHYAMGQVLEHLGKSEEASRYYRLVRTTHPGFSDQPYEVVPDSEGGRLTIEAVRQDQSQSSWIVQMFRRLWPKSNPVL